jgi:acyl-CoA thioester hydrolase
MTFRMPITPRYMEIDSQGVVFNGWYLTWFDEAMAAFLTDRGLPYPELIKLGFDVHVVRSEIDYKSGVRWGDDVAVAVSTGRIGNTSFALDFQVVRGTDVCVTGRNVYVVVASDFSGKLPVPPQLREVLGEPAPLLPA